MFTEALSSDTTPDLASEPALSECRLAANRANAQLSTGPRTVEGKAKSSLNAVKTGLCGHAILVADAEQAEAYRAHIRRVFAWWNPDNVEEHALVQALADTQWRLESIPGLESALYAQARLRGTPVLQHSDPAVQRLLLDAQAEVAEAKALRNLRLHERRLRRQFEQDKAELNALQKERFKQEADERRAELVRQEAEARREREEAERQQREEQARRRRERRQVRQAQQTAGTEAPSALLDAPGFEFSTSGNTQGTKVEQPENKPENLGGPVLQHRP